MSVTIAAPVLVYCFGVAHSLIETDIASIKTDSNSFFAGAYGHFNLGAVDFTASLIGGYEAHDNERLVVDNMNGFETAAADFGSFYLSPSILVSRDYTVARGLTLRPSVMLTYGVGFYEDYQESGTTLSNLGVADRTVQVLSSRWQLAAYTVFGTGNELELRVGASTRHTDEGDIEASLAGTNFQYAALADDSVYGGYLGGNYRLALRDKISLLLDMEYGKVTGDEYAVSGELSLQIAFF